jgi:hypothetical protein
MRFELILRLLRRERDSLPHSHRRIGFGAGRLGTRLEAIVNQHGERFAERRPGRRILLQVPTLRRFDCDAQSCLIEPAFEVQHAAL